MKKQWMMTMLMVLFVMGSLSAQNGRGQRGGQGGQGGPGGNNDWDMLMQLPLEPLSENEQNGLLALREEEKLARDVYLKLFEIWNQRTFSQIAKSEQQHMDAVNMMLGKYGITDPVDGLDVGIFQSEAVQILYDTLVADGSVSLVQALRVGAKIEDLDISDVMKNIEQTDNVDLLTLWQNLAKGSRNHLRAFVSRMELFGATYVPEFISQDLFTQIIESEMERGFYDSTGNPAFSATGK